MRGMKILIRGGGTRDRYPPFLETTKFKAGRHARVDRATRSWLPYAHLIFWISLCAFIITLGPDLWWLITSERPAESSVTGAKFSSRNRVDHQAHIQARPLFSTSPLELKLERLQDAKRRSTGRDVRRAPAKFRHKAIASLADNGRSPSGLSAEFKIFVYDLPPKFNQDWLIDARCSSHLFAAEVAIHQILLTSPLRTRRPEEADFFFMPVYVSCNFSTKTGFPSVAHAPSLLRSAVDLVSLEMPYWNRSKGSDHIFVATHDHGACFHTMEDIALAAGIPDFLRRSVILQTFGRTDAHPCQDVEYIQIPPYISPSSVQQVWAPPEKQRRDIWVFFRGKMEIHPKNINGRVYSRGIRTVIWQKFGRDSRFYIKRKRSADYQLEIRRSTFCLCPLGWAPWSPRIVEAVVFGCVPVIIADNISLPYSHLINWSQISLNVPEKDVGKLDKILEKVSQTNLTTLQRNLWKEQNRRALLYTQPQVEGDASWQIFELLATKLNRSARHSFSLS